MSAASATVARRAPVPVGGRTLSLVALAGILANQDVRSPFETSFLAIATAAVLLAAVIASAPLFRRVRRRPMVWLAIGALLLVATACHGPASAGPGPAPERTGPLTNGLWGTEYTFDWQPRGSGQVYVAPNAAPSYVDAREIECSSFNASWCWAVLGMTWEGYVRVPVEGDYVVTNYADDGARIWIDGQPVVDNWGPAGFLVGNTVEATLHLTAGDHPYYEEYYNANGLVANTWTTIGGTSWVNRGPGRGQASVDLTDEGTPAGLENNPNQCKCASPVDPATSATGNFYHAETDLHVPGPGYGLDFTRTYNSRDPRATSLGIGWTHSYATRLTRGADQSVLVVYPDGRYDRYTRNPDGSYQPPTFTPDRLEKAGDGYILTRKDRAVWRFDLRGRLLSLADRNGQATTLTYAADGKLTGAKDAAGRTLAFQYDANGRLATATDPAGRTVQYAYTTDGRVASVTLPGSMVMRYAHDASGRLESIADPDGNVVLRNRYDAQGRLVSQTDPFGSTTALAYDDVAHTTMMTDPRGTLTVDRHDARGFLVSRVVQAPGLAATTLRTYDANGYLATLVDAGGHVARFQFDPRGNLLSQSDGLGRTQTFGYDAQDNLVRGVDPRGAVSTFAYDVRGNLERVEQQLDASTSATSRFTYDARGVLTAVQDANGHTATFGYDATGNLTSVTDALGRTRAFSYDVLGRPTEATDARGVKTRFSYDAAGRLTQVVADAGGLSLATTFTYDGRGNLLAATDPNGHARVLTYDAAGRLVSVANALGNVTRFGYDAFGNRTGVVDAAGQPWSYTYDVLNRLVQATDPLQQSERFAYDLVGNLVSTTDELGRQTRLRYDAADQLVELLDAGGGRVAIGYDLSGNPTSLVDPNGHASTFAYGLAGRLLAETDALGNVWRSSYDAVGNLVRAVDAKGQVTIYSYDAADQVTRVVYADGTSVAHAYDPNGNRTRLVDATGSTSATFDALNRPLSVEQPGQGTVRYAYDGAGNRTGLTLPNGRGIAFAYDAADRLMSVTDEAGRLTRYTYDARGLPLSTALPNGVSAQRTYDALGRLLTIQHQRASQTLAHFAYTLDAVGNRLQAVETVADDNQRDGDAPRSITLTYRYDALGRLLDVQTSDKRRAERFTYDPAGNRLSATRDGRTTTATFDAANRLLTAGDRQFTYDANGQLLQVTRERKVEQAFTWDARGLLVAVDGRLDDEDEAPPDHDVRDGVRYRYNGDGVRVARSQGQTTTALLQDLVAPLPLVLQERTTRTEDEHGDPNVRTYLWGLGLVSQTSTTPRPAGGSDGEKDDHWQALLPDGLGSTRTLVNAQGDLGPRLTYSAFGEPVRSPTVRTTFGYAGQQTDRLTGLQDLRARWYSPRLGRFLSRDPLLHGAPGSQGFNRYAYVANNPTNGTDPSGLDVNCQGIPNKPAALVCEVITDAPKLAELASRVGPRALELARNLGRAGELAARITKNTARIKVPNVEGRYRVPDVLSREERMLGEVKNAISLSYTKQLQDYVAYAAERQYEFRLIVRQCTQLSAPLQELVDQKVITLLRLLE